MGYFSDANLTGGSDIKAQRKHNYLVELLERGYIVSKSINSKLARVEVSPDKVINYKYDGDELFSISPITGEVVIGKYDAAIAASEISAKNDLAQKLGYTDYADMVAEATAGNTIINGGWLRTNLIESNSIIASKLMIGNFDNILENPGYEQELTGWNGIAGAVPLASSTSHSGNYSLRFNGNGTLLRAVATQRIEVVPGDQYYLEVWYKAAATGGTATVPAVYFYDKDDVYVSSTGTTRAATSAWTKATKIVVIPADIKYIRALVQVNTDNTAGAWYFDDWLIRRAVSGTLVVDGKITSVDGSNWFDLETPEFVQTAVIDSKDVRVEMSPANPFKLQIEGATDMQDHIYVTDASGYSGPNILVTSKYDINEDGKVDWQDMYLLWNYVLKRDLPGHGAWPDGYPSTHRLDVNNDGNVNSTDIYELFTKGGIVDRISNGTGETQLIANQHSFTYSEDAGITEYTVPDLHMRSTAASSGTSSDDWMQLAEIRLTAQYAWASFRMSVISVPSTAGVGYAFDLYATVIQQLAMGNAPLGRVYVSNPIGMAIANVVAVITTNDATETIIELYAQTTQTYKTLSTKVLAQAGTGSIDFTLGTAWVNAVPAGSQLTTYLAD